MPCVVHKSLDNIIFFILLNYAYNQVNVSVTSSKPSSAVIVIIGFINVQKNISFYTLMFIYIGIFTNNFIIIKLFFKQF